MPKESRVSTVKGDVVFCVCGEEIPLTTRTLVAAGLTEMPESEPDREPFTVSVAVTDWKPAVFSVTPLVKVWRPLSSPAPVVNL